MTQADERLFRFDKPFNFIPPEDRRVSVYYKPGIYRVRKVCAAMALADGCGEYVGSYGADDFRESAGSGEVQSANQSDTEADSGGDGGRAGEELGGTGGDGEASGAGTIGGAEGHDTPKKSSGFPQSLLANWRGI